MNRGAEMLQDHADKIGATIGKVGVISGSASAFFFGLTASEFAAVSGVFIAILGLVIQWYYNRRKDRRESEEHVARMSRYRERADVAE